jgi:hypothetical protein
MPIDPALRHGIDEQRCGGSARPPRRGSKSQRPGACTRPGTSARTAPSSGPTRSAATTASRSRRPPAPSWTSPASSACVSSSGRSTRPTVSASSATPRSNHSSTATEAPPTSGPSSSPLAVRPGASWRPSSSPFSTATSCRLPQTNSVVDGIEVDAAWRTHGVIVELDGYAFHGTHDLRNRPQEIATQLRALLSMPPFDGPESRR